MTDTQSIFSQEVQQTLKNKLEEYTKNHDCRLTYSLIRDEILPSIDIEVTYQAISNNIDLESFKQENGLEQYDNAVEVWADRLEEEYGRYRYEEFKQILDDTSVVNDYRPGKYKRDLAREIGRRDDIRMKFSGNANLDKDTSGRFRVFIDTDYEKRMQSYKERLPDQEITGEWFDHALSKGCSPKTVMAAIRYLTQDGGSDEGLTQSQVAEEEDVSDAGLRLVINRLNEDFGLEKLNRAGCKL